MAIAKAVMSSNKDTWCTPTYVLDRVREVGHIAFDPCPHPESLVSADVENSDKCGLAIPWMQAEGPGQIAFVNPPYSDVTKWMAKCVNEAELGVQIVALIPARTDTRWFDCVWNYADAVCFWRGRIKFMEDGNPSKNSAPFPSAVVYYGNQVRRFEAAFETAGKVVRL